VNSQSSMDHIARDLIVHWQRAVVFVVLVSIGLMIWVTCLIYSALEEPSRNRAIPRAAETVSVKQDFLNRRNDEIIVLRSNK
jgi:hypothetical protein